MYTLKFGSMTQSLQTRWRTTASAAALLFIAVAINGHALERAAVGSRDISAVRSFGVQMEALKAANEAAISALIDRLALAEGRIASLEITSENLENRMHLAETEISDLKLQVTTLQARMTAAEADIATLEAQLVLLQSRIGNIESFLDALSRRVSLLEGDMATATSKISALQAELNTLKSRVAALESKTTSVDAVAGTGVFSVGKRTAVSLGKWSLCVLTGFSSNEENHSCQVTYDGSRNWTLHGNTFNENSPQCYAQCYNLK